MIAFLVYPRLSVEGGAFVGREPTIEWTRTTDLLITNNEDNGRVVRVGGNLDVEAAVFEDLRPRGMGL